MRAYFQSGWIKVGLVLLFVGTGPLLYRSALIYHRRRRHCPPSQVGVHVSIGDMIMLGTVLLVASLTWRLQASFR